MRLRPHATIVAAAVLALGLAGCGGGDGASPAPTTEADVELTGDDTLKFDTTEVSAEPGEVVIQLANEGSVPHNVVIEEASDTLVTESTGGETTQGTIELEAGTYTFYCNVEGHRDAGMEGTLTVE